MNAEVFLRCCEELNVDLDWRNCTYLPMRLDCLVSELGSGIVTVLLDRIDPLILKALRAMVGSYPMLGCFTWMMVTLPL